MKKANNEKMEVKLIANFPVSRSLIYAVKEEENGERGILSGDYNPRDMLDIMRGMVESLLLSEKYLDYEKIIDMTAAEKMLSAFRYAFLNKDGKKANEIIEDEFMNALESINDEYPEEDANIVAIFLNAAQKLKEDIRSGLKDRQADNE